MPKEKQEIKAETIKSTTPDNILELKPYASALSLWVSPDGSLETTVKCNMNVDTEDEENPLPMSYALCLGLTYLLFHKSEVVDEAISAALNELHGASEEATS